MEERVFRDCVPILSQPWKVTGELIDVTYCTSSTYSSAIFSVKLNEGGNSPVCQYALAVTRAAVAFSMS